MQPQERADLEEPSGDIKAPGDVAPFLQVPQASPARDAVIHYEEVAALSLLSHLLARPWTLSFIFPRHLSPAPTMQQLKFHPLLPARNQIPSRCPPPPSDLAQLAQM